MFTLRRVAARRDAIDPRHPLHVTTRVVPELGSLRKRDLYHAIREATIAVFEREGFHLVHASVQRSHLHLLAEAEDKDTLAAGMKAFLVSAAKRINRALWRRTGVRRRGKVFADRYKPVALTTPRQVRNCIAYVLNNFCCHGEDRAPIAASWKVDPFSTGVFFNGWVELGDSPSLFIPRRGYLAMQTWLPKTWLLRVGWKKSGSVSVYEVPGRP